MDPSIYHPKACGSCQARTDADLSRQGILTCWCNRFQLLVRAACALSPRMSDLSLPLYEVNPQGRMAGELGTHQRHSVCAKTPPHWHLSRRCLGSDCLGPGGLLQARPGWAWNRFEPCWTAASSMLQSFAFLSGLTTLKVPQSSWYQACKLSPFLLHTEWVAVPIHPRSKPWLFVQSFRAQSTRI